MSFLSAIAVISLLVMFPVLLSLRKTGVPGIASFSAACFLTTLAASMALTASIAPVWFHTIAGGILIVAASPFDAEEAFRQFLGRETRGAWLIAVNLAVVATALLFFSYGAHSHSARIVIGNALLSLICFVIGATILRHWPREPGNRSVYAVLLRHGFSWSLSFMPFGSQWSRPAWTVTQARRSG
jgi:hypothetical protein